MSDQIDFNQIYLRNRLIWGNEAQKFLWGKHVAVFGLGGVGGHAAEALARAGIGVLTILDCDFVEITNFNRQLIATLQSYKQKKTDVLENRIKSINPDIAIKKYNIFYDSSQRALVLENNFDFIVDAIDSVYPKIDLIELAITNNINIVSSMGTGNRLDPTKLEIRDISETKGLACPFSRKIRTLLKKKEIETGLNLVISTEAAIKPDYSETELENFQHKPPASSPFVPPVAGIIMAGYVIQRLLETNT